MAGQVAHQPLNARIEVPPGGVITFKFLINTLRVEHIASAIFRTFACAHNAGDFNSRLILRRQRQLNGVQLAFREAFHTVTGVTEQHAAGAVAIHQHRNQLLTGALGIFAVAVCCLQQRLDILLADHLAEHVQFVIAQFVTCQQHGNGVRNRTIIFLLFNELREIVETVRVQQTQTGEVAFHPQLFRGCGQQQNARHVLCQLFNGLIFAARRIFAPHQMMGFIDHQQVPLGFTEMFQTLFATTGKIQRANHQLFGIERVVSIVLSFGITLIIKQSKAQVETAQHFYQPLML